MDRGKMVIDWNDAISIPYEVKWLVALSHPHKIIGIDPKTDKITAIQVNNNGPIYVAPDARNVLITGSVVLGGDDVEVIW